MPENNATDTTQLSLLQRAGRNFARLLGGRGVAAVLELLSITLLARSLTPEYPGQIVLIQAYALVVRSDCPIRCAAARGRR